MFTQTLFFVQKNIKLEFTNALISTNNTLINIWTSPPIVPALLENSEVVKHVRKQRNSGCGSVHHYIPVSVNVNGKIDLANQLLLTTTTLPPTTSPDASLSHTTIRH